MCQMCWGGRFLRLTSPNEYGSSMPIWWEFSIIQWGWKKRWLCGQWKNIPLLPNGAPKGLSSIFFSFSFFLASIYLFFLLADLQDPPARTVYIREFATSWNSYYVGYACIFWVSDSISGGNPNPLLIGWRHFTFSSTAYGISQHAGDEFPS